MAESVDQITLTPPEDWVSLVKSNPIPRLFDEDDLALKNRILRDIVEAPDEAPDEPVLDDTVYKTLVRRQKPDGSWRESGKKKNEDVWTFITTLRSFYLLLDRGSGWGDPVFEKGVKFILLAQTSDGDFRGAYGPDIPGPDYTGMVVEILLRGECPDTEPIQKALEWLVDIRRNDGGWAIPVLRSDSKSDKSSHCVTGMVLRAFAADPENRFDKEANKAGLLLANRIFKPDAYPDRRSVEYWGKLTYPFWFTDALSALDVLYKLGFDLSAGKMQRAFDWLLKQQNKDGYWHSDSTRSELSKDAWLTYAVLRVIKGFST